MNRWEGADTLVGLVNHMHLGLGGGWPHQQAAPAPHHALGLVAPAHVADLVGHAGYAGHGGGSGYSPPAGGFAHPPHPHPHPLPPPQQPHPLAAPAYPPAPDSLGWGGQAIPDAAGFKAPWFGKARARGAGARGRGRARDAHPGAARGGRARRAFGDDGAGEDAAVEALVAAVRAHPQGAPLGASAYQALFQLEGRSCAALLKELARAGLGARAAEVFDWLRALDAGHPLAALLDVYSYTAAVSLCIADHDVSRALGLAAEMQARRVERNVHTYTALMNVCIKASKHALALETFRLMRADGCAPNVVTYNTLIDVHGKMGAWEEAVAVLGAMRAEGVAPVLRTYNTLLIACNMCAQPREAVAVYRRMLDDGFAPNSTTYNALISAYGKAGQLERVMEVFQEMMYRGCERSVITYSSLISACEKAGQWELALELFHEMVREQCAPNTVTFNSLITALGQGGQWEKAREVFEQMGARGCTPDVVTYTALISALEKGGQWRAAAAAFDRMRLQGCRADAIVYNAAVDALWGTGVVWAQRRALALFRAAVEEGHFQQARLTPGLPRAEVNLHAMTAGVAMLSLYAWAVSLRQLVAAAGPAAAPARLAVVTDRGRGAKEQGNLVVREAVAALLAAWGAPFRPAADGAHSGTLEAPGAAAAEWALSEAFEARLFSFFPCTDIVPAVANSARGRDPAAAAAVAALLDDPASHKETCVEQRCSEAFAAVRHFEKTHCLALQNMGCAYLQRRADLVGRCLAGAAALGARDDAGHDAVLLMDRVMSTSLALAPDLLELLAAACVVVAAKQVDGPAPAAGGGGGGGGGGAPGGGGGPPPGGGAGLEAASGLPAAAVAQMEWNVRQVLAQDTAAISALRCLKLYLERLGAHHMDPGAAAALAGRALALADGCLADMAFLNCRPSVIAAAVLYTDRRARGAIPFWPTMLAKLTGYQDMSTAELSVAIKAAQRVAARGAGGPAAAAFAPALSLDHAAPSKPLTQLNLAAAAAGRASGVATPSQGVPHAVAATGSGGTSSRGSSGSGGGSGGGSVEEGGLLGITAAVAARYMRRRE